MTANEQPKLDLEARLSEQNRALCEREDLIYGNPKFGLVIGIDELERVLNAARAEATEVEAAKARLAQPFTGEMTDARRAAIAADIVTVQTASPSTPDEGAVAWRIPNWRKDGEKFDYTHDVSTVRALRANGRATEVTPLFASPFSGISGEQIARVLYERHPAIRWERGPRGQAPLNRPATWEEATFDEREEDLEAADAILTLTGGDKAKIEAAEPFFKLAREVINPSNGERPWHAESKDWMVVFSFAGQSVTLGDLRRAAAATTDEGAGS